MFSRRAMLRRSAVGFGYLALASLLTVCFGDAIIDWYLAVSGMGQLIG
jgi:hypothetical protein